MTFTERRQRFRAILAGEACVHPASVFDPLSARIAGELGFECGILAGSVASMVVLGAPDLVILTLTELAEQVRRITRASALPLLVDADHGYGNALSVMRTVVELETSGVAALTIEDTDLPRPFGTTAPGLVSREEGLGKMRAAVAARTDPSLVIVGRTSAFAIAGAEEAVARARLYAEAGVDALFFTGISDVAQIAAVRAVASLPIMLGGGGDALGGRDALAAAGVRIALQGHAPFAAAVRAVRDAMAGLREGTFSHTKAL